LLRWYPAAWRARYGEELEELIRESTGGGRVPWRMRLEIARSGIRERLRVSGLMGDGVSPDARSRAGSLLVLCAWMMFVVAGAIVQKLSEHWQEATPRSQQALPAAAFVALTVAAAIGSALVVLGIACAGPALLALVRAGGWRDIRGVILRALAVTAVAGMSTTALVVWAHRLPARARSGHDLAYVVGFCAWSLVMLVFVASWTIAAVSTARRLDLSERLLRFEARLAVGVCTTMAVMTVATALWWSALADAPSATALQLAIALLLMLGSTSLGTAGAVRAFRP
jgi:hypothetical protein